MVEAQRSRKYSYDLIERLVQAEDNAANPVETYQLDEEGNRIASHRSSYHLTDPANRLTEDEQHLYEYDVNGNMVAKVTKATGETWRYSYSIYDELILAERFASATATVADKSVSYTYDPFGRRRSRSEDGFTTWFFHDGANVVLADSRDDTAPLTPMARTWFTQAGVDGHLAMTLKAASTNGPDTGSYYYHADHQGSIRAITDDGGQVVSSYEYDSYGNRLAAAESVEQPYGFTGREYDTTTGLYHYRARVYDPATGRFLQEDPLWFGAGDANIYRYTWNNPGNWTDPSGMSSSEDAGSTALIASTAAGFAATGIGINCTLSVVGSALNGAVGAELVVRWATCNVIERVGPPGVKKLAQGVGKIVRAVRGRLSGIGTGMKPPSDGSSFGGTGGKPSGGNPAGGGNGGSSGGAGGSGGSGGSSGGSGGSGGGDEVFRGMRAGDNGMPSVEPSARGLGVRTTGKTTDITPDCSGCVQPGTGGMSVADTPANLQPFRRPPEFGGTGRDPVWSIDPNNLGPDLVYRQDTPTHGLIEPARKMTLEAYEKALAETIGRWTKIK